jgi:hypothetical protein
MKQCTKCKEMKELSCFGKEKYGKYGIRSQCKDCRKIIGKQYRNQNIKKVTMAKKKWNDKNPNYQQQYRQANTIKAQKYYKQWCKNNREKTIEYSKKYKQYNIKMDPIFKLKQDIRALIYHSFRRQNYTKTSKTYKILGCNWQSLHIHLKQSFIKNYHRTPNKNDTLHIDHKIPLAIAKTKDDVIKLCHYTNLQWLLAKDNLEKKDKLDWTLTKGENRA